jgi:EAL domain-containing protein (putative c-di-GMP-specific phosphodiesterase class I)
VPPRCSRDPLKQGRDPRLVEVPRDSQGLHPRLLFHDRLARAMQRAEGAGEKIALLCLADEDWEPARDRLAPLSGGAPSCWCHDGKCLLLFEHLGGDFPAFAAEVARHLGETKAGAGLAAFPDHAADPDALCAATALAFESDAPGTCRAPAEPEPGTPGLPEPAPARRDRLQLHYQPQVELDSGHIPGVEALARLHGGVSMPDGQKPIGFWALERAVSDLAAWRAQGVENLRVAVNLSLELLVTPGLAGRVADLLRGAGVAPANLEIEVTEDRPSPDPHSVMTALQDLRGLGLSLALDDFGTGFASLSLLDQLPLDRLKIDMSYVAALDDAALGEDSERLVRDVIGLAHRRGLTVVAEGVERLGQLQVLRRLGCDAAQGYLFSPPLPPERLLEALSAGSFLPGGQPK